MNKCFGFVWVSLLCFSASANIAMPGIWNAGVGGQFYPLFPQDSIHFGKIRMQKELILVNLYPGFAVVKGEYSFVNTTDKPIRMQVGYPVNGRYPQEVVENVIFNDLYNFRALSDGKPVKAYRLSDSGSVSPLKIGTADNPTIQISNWYAWEQEFPAGSVTTLTVYFITQNNLARFKKGYDSRDGNAFGYILESGKAWSGKIGVGQILVKLNDQLSLIDIRGILPDSQLVGDLQHLQYSFSNLEPEPENNLLIWYEGAPPDFKFDKKVLPSTDTLYQMMDEFPLSEFNNTAFKPISRKNFSLAKSGLTLSGVVYFLMFFLPWILLAVIIFFLLKGKKKK